MGSLARRRCRNNRFLVELAQDHLGLALLAAAHIADRHVDPGWDWEIRSRNSAVEPTDFPLTLTRTSPRSIPASSAGLSSLTWTTSAPRLSPNPNSEASSESIS